MVTSKAGIVLRADGRSGRSMLGQRLATNVEEAVFLIQNGKCCFRKSVTRCLSSRVRRSDQTDFQREK